MSAPGKLRVVLTVEMPDDFLVATLTPSERDAIIFARFQSALDAEYPYAAGQVRVTVLTSVPSKS